MIDIFRNLVRRLILYIRPTVTDIGYGYTDDEDEDEVVVYKRPITQKMTPAQIAASIRVLTVFRNMRCEVTNLASVPGSVP